MKIIPPSPQKKKKAFSAPKKEDAIGWRVGILWAADKTVYYGLVHSYDADSKKHGVVYDDGTFEMLTLHRVQVEWVQKTHTLPAAGQGTVEVAAAPQSVENEPASKKPKLAAATAGGKDKKNKKKVDPKKAAATVVGGAEAVGTQIGVWWDDDKTFYYGTVADFNKEEKKHFIHYEDGTQEWLDLSKEVIEMKVTTK